MPIAAPLPEYWTPLQQFCTPPQLTHPDSSFYGNTWGHHPTLFWAECGGTGGWCVGGTGQCVAAPVGAWRHWAGRACGQPIKRLRPVNLTTKLQASQTKCEVGNTFLATPSIVQVSRCWMSSLFNLSPLAVCQSLGQLPEFAWEM